MEDDENQRQNYSVDVEAAIIAYDLILGIDGRRKANPDIDWVAGEWTLRKPNEAENKRNWKNSDIRREKNQANTDQVFEPNEADQRTRQDTESEAPITFLSDICMIALTS